MLKKFGKYLLPAGIMALVAAFFLIGAANLETPKTPGKIEPPAPPAEPKDAVVLYTNDVHCGIDGYAALAALRAQIAEEGLDVIVVDDGDYVQGEMIGGYYKGTPIIELMNAVPYTLATFGNHEFDYGMDQLKKLIGMMKFEPISCNIDDLTTGKTLATPYKIPRTSLALTAKSRTASQRRICMKRSSPPLTQPARKARRLSSSSRTSA